MNDGGSDQTPVVEVAAALPRRRWLTLWFVCGMLVITIAGSLAWAASGDSPQRDSLAPAADDSAPTETTTNETVVVVTADTVVDTVPVDTIPVDTLDPAATGPDATCAPQKPGDPFCNAEKCIGTKARNPHSFALPSFAGQTVSEALNISTLYYWDAMCSGKPLSFGFATDHQECTADPGMAGKIYAQSPSPGTAFTFGSVMIHTSVYMYCPPAPPSIDPPATDPPPTSPAETSPPPSP